MKENILFWSREKPMSQQELLPEVTAVERVGRRWKN